MGHAADPLVASSKLQFTRHFQIDDGGAQWPVTKQCDFGPNVNTRSERDLLKIDGMEAPRTARAGFARLSSGNPGRFEWKRFLLERLSNRLRGGPWRLKALARLEIMKTITI